MKKVVDPFERYVVSKKSCLLSTSKTWNIGIDVDDVLGGCAEWALNLWNKEHPEDQLDVNKLTCWGYREGSYARMYEYFSKPEFVQSQPVMKGAQELIHELAELPNVQVYFITAVPVEMMGLRGKWLMDNFPWVPTHNFVLSSAKEVAQFDIFIDDAAHNLFANKSKYRICRRQPWNGNISGMLSYSTFEELRMLIFNILNKGNAFAKIEIPSPCVFALVGPSGAGKNAIADILETKGMERPVSYTTKSGEKDRKYLSESDFIAARDSGKFLTSTVYGTYKFGMAHKDISDILKRGKNVISVVDMAGAAALQTKFPTVVIYRDLHYEELLRTILNRPYSLDEKVNRIMALTSDQQNKELCDFYIPPTDNADEAAERIMNTITP